MPFLEAVNISEADNALDALLELAIGLYNDSDGKPPVMAGNSVHMDWILAQKFLPLFSRRLHYRLLDVTSFKLEWMRRRHRTELTKKILKT